MIYIGCHLSVTDGYKAMGRKMSSFGGNTFAWFTRNPRGGKSKPLRPEDVTGLCDYIEKEKFGPLVAHASYTMNLCSAKEETRVNDLDGVLQKFDDTIGISRLKAVHLNDSKNECGSRKDRHEKLGHGYIGMEAMKRIVNHPALQGLPFILETPNDDVGYMKEIRVVKDWQ